MTWFKGYKQVRLTLTEERGGRVSVRCMVKPLSTDWTPKHLVWHRTAQLKYGLHNMEEVYSTLIDFLLEPTLPEESTSD